MILYHNKQKYQSLPTGERISVAHYYLEDDMRMTPAQPWRVGDDVGPWEVGLWFRAEPALKKAPPPLKAGTLYVDPFGTIRSRLGKSDALPDACQAAAVTADALSDWGEDHGNTVAPQPDKALTYDEGKAPLAHLPWDAVSHVAMVQAYGQKKYGDFYNYKKGMEVGRNLSCAIRHIRDYMNGENQDEESGCNPLAHAACRLLFVLQNLADGTAIDDRYTSRKTLSARGAL